MPNIERKKHIIKVVSAACALLFFLAGCSTVSAKKCAPVVSKRTGIPEQSIRIAARCSYAATDVGSNTGNSASGIFILTDKTIALYNNTNVTKLPQEPVYRFNFDELNGMAIASYGLAHQLQFYKGKRLLAVTLWNKYSFTDKKRSLQVYNYMTRRGVKKRANAQLIFLGAPAPSY